MDRRLDRRLYFAARVEDDRFLGQSIIDRYVVRQSEDSFVLIFVFIIRLFPSEGIIVILRVVFF